MIENLPSKVTVNQLTQFRFGDADAAHDSLLLNKECICATKAAETFLRNQTSILLGERGTGKTGLIRLLCEGFLELQSLGEKEQVYIKIDDKLDYKLIRNCVIPNVISKFEDESLTHMLIWEVLFTSILINYIETKFDPPDYLKKQFTDFKEFFEIQNAKKGIVKLFLEQKKQVGIKLNPSQIGNLFAWDFYASLSPESKEDSAPKNQGQILKVGKIKESVDKFLKSIGTRFYILVDRLDEFVTKDDYKTQLSTILGLLHTERSYRDFDNIQIKISIRQDLFERLDLRELGADKILSRSTRLEWKKDNIKHLIATRVLYNYFRVFKLRKISIHANRENCYIDQTSNDISPLISKPPNYLLKLIYRIPYVRRIKNKYNYSLDSGRGRKTNLTEEIDETIIRSFFGDRVLHYNEQGNPSSTDVFQFLETHFVTGLNSTTPRIMIRFLDLCITEAEDYYKNNPDIPENNIEFPLIPKECVMAAYISLKDELWNHLGQESDNFRELIYSFRENVKKEQFTFNYVRKQLKLDSEDDTRDLLAVLQHLGIIYCTSKSKPLVNRSYKYPLLFWPINLPRRRY